MVMIIDSLNLSYYLYLIIYYSLIICHNVISFMYKLIEVINWFWLVNDFVVLNNDIYFLITISVSK